MDIPVPEKKPESDGQKVPVTVASSADTTKPDATAKQESLKAPDATSSIEERTKQIAELISSKKFMLSIKEKRSAPLITFGFAKSKDRKAKKTTKKTKEKKPNAQKKLETRKARTTKFVIVLLLWAVAYVALDLGYIDVGWRPPFTLFGQKQSEGTEVLQTPTEVLSK